MTHTPAMIAAASRNNTLSPQQSALAGKSPVKASDAPAAQSSKPGFFNSVFTPPSEGELKAREEVNHLLGVSGGFCNK